VTHEDLLRLRPIGQFAKRCLFVSIHRTTATFE
jgi:hypothetical protein